MLILRQGDPHVKVSNLEESEKLMRFVLQTAIERKIDRLEILGDLFHTHAILRIEVLEFWNKWLRKICTEHEIETVVIVGNHDQTGDYKSTSHALSVFKNSNIKNLTIVEEGYRPNQAGPLCYMGYYHDQSEFIGMANLLAAQGAKVLVCHHTFNGSKFENGFYAPEGTNPDELKFDTIISGHIHARQRFDKVIYPGTARWDTASDANQPKGLWLVDHDDTTGAIKSEEFIDTANVCTPIFSFELKEGDEMPAALTFPGNAKISVELIGSSAWVSEKKAELKGKFAVKTKITDKSKPAARKAGGNLRDFVENLFVSTMDRSHLLAMMKELDLG